MIYVGIDPGQSGGIAIIQGEVVTVRAMPVRDKEIDAREIHSILAFLPERTMVFMERVHAMPGQGVTSMFTFGKGYGKILGVLETMDIPYVLITPQTWKNVVLVGTDKGKSAAVEFCRARYPKVLLLETPRCRVPHDGMADALCIAEYGRVTER